MRDQTFPPCLIVIDALDECKDGSATSTILSACLCSLAAFAKSFRFLHNSRPVRWWSGGSTSRPAERDKGTCADNIPLDISQKDIGSICTTGFRYRALVWAGVLARSTHEIGW